MVSLTLLESDRSFLRSAELITLSIAMHAAVVGLALAGPAGSFRLPDDERDARVMFLLPPDRAPAAERTAEIPLPGKPGSGLEEASALPDDGQGMRLEANVRKSRREGERSGAKGDEPFGPAPFLAAKVYSALEVDQMAERYESSVAPEYPPELSARGTEGAVEAKYVVDIAGTGGYDDDQGDAERSSAVHGVGADGARGDAVPAGEAWGGGGSAAGGAAVSV